MAVEPCHWLQQSARIRLDCFVSRRLFGVLCCLLSASSVGSIKQVDCYYRHANEVACAAPEATKSHSKQRSQRSQMKPKKPKIAEQRAKPMASQHPLRASISLARSFARSRWLPTCAVAASAKIATNPTDCVGGHENKPAKESKRAKSLYFHRFYMLYVWREMLVSLP